mmetsp:Transcript_6957/g.19658  ORF Transcript_6957/g.19658 Transcript_6957/m.19658 type:complete len:410 (+) Transcript_6957:121-1350(+)
MGLVACYRGVAKIIGAQPMEKPPEPLAALKALPRRARFPSPSMDASTMDSLPHLCSSTSDEGSADWMSHTPSTADSVEGAVQALMHEAGNSVAHWQAGRFEDLRVIQEAPRNHGCVLLMKDLSAGGSFAAVKKMPTHWVAQGPAEFDRSHPTSSERPWLDLGVVRFLQQGGYEHICRPLGVFRDSTFTYVVSEFANEGDLFSWLSAGQGANREEALRPLAVQLVGAVRLLHNLGVAHQDLSLENVLLTREGTDGGLRIKLVDFAMASLSRWRRAGACGKRSYMPPELHVGGTHDAFLGDAFSVGVCLYTLTAGEYPWDYTRRDKCRRFAFIAEHGLREYMSLRKVKAGSDTRLAQVVSPVLVDVLDALLAIEPQTRACLGERVFAEEVASGTSVRASVCDFEWLREEES